MCSHFFYGQETAWPALCWLVTFPVSLQPPLTLGLSKPQLSFSPSKHYTARSEALILLWMESTENLPNFVSCVSGPIGLNVVCLQVNAVPCVMPRAAAGSPVLSTSRRGIKHNDFFTGSCPRATSSPKVPLTFIMYSPCSVWDWRAGFALVRSADLRHLPLDVTYWCNKGRHFICMCRS